MNDQRPIDCDRNGIVRLVEVAAAGKAAIREVGSGALFGLST